MCGRDMGVQPPRSGSGENGFGFSAAAANTRRQHDSREFYACLPRRAFCILRSLNRVTDRAPLAFVGAPGPIFGGHSAQLPGFSAKIFFIAHQTSGAINSRWCQKNFTPE